MKRLLCFFLALVLAFPIPVGSFEAAAEEIDFTCGENLTWALDAATKTLTISGTGRMNDYTGSGSGFAPWKAYLTEIETLVVEDGVTSIGKCAFIYLSRLVTARIGEGVQTIGAKAFYSCSKLQSVSLPATLREIDQQVFGNTSVLRSITFPNGCGLLSVNENAFRSGGTAATSRWYQNQPDGCVYLGDLLFDYKGTMPENTTLRVREGTRVIQAKFQDQVNLVDLAIPDSIFSIGGNRADRGAFDGTTWLQNQRQTVQGVIYAGQVAYCFNGSMQVGQEIVLREGTTGIAACAFYQEQLLSKLVLPDSLICIQWNGISNCSNLKTPDLSHVQYLYSYAINNLSAETLTVPASLRWAQKYAFSLGKQTKQVIFEDQALLTELPPFIVHDSNAPSYLQHIQLADNCETLRAQTFFVNHTNQMRSIMIPPSVRKIERKFIRDDNEAEVKPTIQCFRGSYAHTFALENDYPFELLDETVLNTAALNEQLTAAQAVDRSLYTDASLAVLDEAVSAVSLGAQTTQTTVDAWAAAIQNAIAGLQYKPADYTAVDAQLRAAQALDRSLYTQASLQALDDAVAAVDRSLPIVRQNEVDAFAQAIAAAIQNAAYRPADYSRVNEAVQAAQGVERALYSAASLAALDEAVNAVDYQLNVTQQEQVDAYADRIDLAVNGLTWCSVVLRNEPHGVLVSATAKEIHPDTLLAVDEIDPSVYEIADFAVGGHIRSVRYYDITLLRQSQVVQPNGTVEVKVRLSEGVDPAKCRVYHVTEDPVDPLVRMTSSLDGNYIVFPADHFSEYAVVEVETVLDHIEVTSLPRKTQLAVGEAFVRDGLEVTAFFSDGTQRVVTDYDCSAVDTSSVGEKTVTVYYTFNGTTKSDRFTVRVTSTALVGAQITLDGSPVVHYDKRVRLFRLYNRESVSFRCSVSTTEKVRIEWSSDNKRVVVDENGNVTNKGWFGARKAVVTAAVRDSAGHLIAQAHVTVCFYKFGFQRRKLVKQSDAWLPDNALELFF